MLDVFPTAARFLTRELIPIAGGFVHMLYAASAERLFGTSDERATRVHLIGGTALIKTFYITIKQELQSRGVPASIHIPISTLLHTRDIPRYLASLVTLFGTRNIVIGHSLGGWAALEALAKHPDTVDRVILTGTPVDDRHIPPGARAVMRFALGMDIEQCVALKTILASRELSSRVVIIASMSDTLLTPAACGTELFEHAHIVDRPPHTTLPHETVDIIAERIRETFAPRPRIIDIDVPARHRPSSSDTWVSDTIRRRS